MPRKTNKVKSNRTVLLSVEGQTEQIYFRSMNVTERIPGITIVPKVASHSDIAHVLELAIRECESGVYDSVWCVFDRDTFEKDDKTGKLSKLVKKAKKKNIKFADSLPAFEVWFLLHYVVPRNYYLNQDSIIDDLRKYISDYTKEQKWLMRKDLYKFLLSRQSLAIDNNKKLEELGKNSSDYTSCNVYKLILELMSLK